MTQNEIKTAAAFTQILETALQLGVIDIFTVIHYQVNGVPSDQVVQDIADKVAAHRPAWRS